MESSQTLRMKNYTSFGVSLSQSSFFFFFRTENNVHPNNIDTVQEPTSDRGQMDLCFEVNGMEGKTKNKYQIHSEMFDIQECEWTLRHDLKTK